MFLGLLFCSLAASAPLSDTQKEDVLRAHNMYRCMHGAPPVTWNSNVADAAVQYGHGLVSLVHANSYELQPPTGPAGENLALEYPTLNIADSVGRWYHEVDDCEGGPEGFTDGCQHGRGGAMVGHFTAMVWQGVQQIGCGLNEGGTILVCRYWSGNSLSAATANMQGSFVSQVRVRQRTSAQCAAEQLSGSPSGSASVSVGTVEEAPSLPSAAAANPATDAAPAPALPAPPAPPPPPPANFSQDPVPQAMVPQVLVEEGPWVCYQSARYRLLALTVPDAASCRVACIQQDVCTRYAFKANTSCDTLPSNCFLYRQDESGNECRVGHNACYMLHLKTAGSSNLVQMERGAMIRTSKPKRQVAIGSQGLATDRDEFPAPTDPQGS